MSASDDSFNTRVSNAQNKKRIHDILYRKGYQIVVPYQDCTTLMTVRCSDPESHEWSGLPAKVALPLNNCRQCWDRLQLKPADRVYAIIDARRGRFLIPYDKSRIKMQIQCEKGHIFDIAPHGIQNGRWCNVCCHSNIDKAKKRFETIVGRKKGRILGSYVNSYEKVKLKCHRDHIFRMTPNHIRQGEWCPKCCRPWYKSK